MMPRRTFPSLLSLSLAGLILGFGALPAIQASAKGPLPAQLSGDMTLKAEGEVLVADDFSSQLNYVRRVTGLNPRQDWQHVLATQPRLIWFKFYLAPVFDNVQWPLGQVIFLDLSDTTALASEEIFVASPDDARTPTFLGRGAGALRSSEFLHHNATTLVVYAGFPRVYRSPSGLDLNWSFSAVKAMRIRARTDVKPYR